MRRTKKQRHSEAAKPARGEHRNPAMRAQAMEAFFLHAFAYIHMSVITLRVVEREGLSVTKLRILALATLTPDLTVGDLVRHLRVTHQAVNEPLRELIRQGYIVAKVGLKDRRHKTLLATRKGSNLYMQHAHRLAKLFEGAFRATSPGAATTVIRVFRRLVQPSDREWIAQALPIAEKAIASD